MFVLAYTKTNKDNKIYFVATIKHKKSPAKTDDFYKPNMFILHSLRKGDSKN